MGFDESLFKFVTDRWKRYRANDFQKNGVEFHTLQSRLESVATALTSWPVRLIEEREGQRSLLNLWTMPGRMASYDERDTNENLYWLRLLFFYGALRTQCLSQLSAAAGSEARHREALAHQHRIFSFLHRDLPRFEVRFKTDYVTRIRLELPYAAWSRQGAETQTMAMGPRVETPSKISEITVKTVSDPQLIHLKEENDNPLVHVFEKVLTADQYQPGTKTVDPSNELAEHADALNELTLDAIARTSRESGAFLKSDAVIESAILAADAPAAAEGQKMREWFHRERVYREEWCTLREFVYETSTDSGATPLRSSQVQSSERRARISALKERLALVFNHYQWAKRQKDGSEIDIDAVIHWYSQREGAVDQRIFCERRRLARDTALLILMDTSLSTDSWLGNRRVLDEMKELALLLSGALEDFSDKVALATFSSESRNFCRFGWLKKFDESWSLLNDRIVFMQPQGYTRMGVAIRKAHQSLLSMKAKRRALILLSDGKPTDFDHYEGHHGSHDVRRAVSEVRDSDIRFHAVVLAEKKSESLAQIFGQGHYQTGTSSEAMADLLIDHFIGLLA